jgi:hypothetical protein
MTIKLSLRRAARFGSVTALWMLLSFAPATAPPPEGSIRAITRTADSAQPGVPDFSGCGGINQPVVNADYEQQVVDLVPLQVSNG